MTDDDQLAEVRAWAAEVVEALGLPSDGHGIAEHQGGTEIDAVLGIAGLAARTSVRPAAPVTTYLLGYAVGKAEAAGASRQEAFADATSSLRRLALQHREDAPGDAADVTGS